MTSQLTCPPRSTWQRILEEGFPDFSVGDLSAHLDGCLACQAAVESLMGGQRSWLAIAAELRQELPPASPVCQRMLDDLKERDPPFPPVGFMPEFQSDQGAAPKNALCPHCLELVQMENERCPVCARLVDGSDKDEANSGYGVNTREPNPHKGRGIQEYVQSLEDRARKDEERVPYHRGRFPIDLVAGLILIGCGLALLFNAVAGGGGLFTTFINVVLPGFVLILVGALCLVFWAK
jgi:hypothetical protein